MITFNLQTACVNSSMPHEHWQCQAGQWLPTDSFINSWNLTGYNMSQWIEVMNSFGAKYAVLVADHFSGFNLWPTALHNYSVASMAWQGGKGDIVNDFVTACRAANIAPGVFVSVHENWWAELNINQRVQLLYRFIAGI